jgi:hypothetical protein
MSQIESPDVAGMICQAIYGGGREQSTLLLQEYAHAYQLVRTMSP